MHQRDSTFSQLMSRAWIEVFSAFTLARWAPKMIIVELVDTHPDLTATAAADAHLGARLQASGYRIAFKDHVNTVLVRDDIWADAFRV